MNETYSVDLPDFVFEESEEKRVKSTINTAVPERPGQHRKSAGFLTVSGA